MAYADPENTLVIETTKGNVVIEMRPDLAPNHVAHIKKLAREGFYNDIVFHRVIDGFMAQTGDPKGDGTGGSGKHLKAEFSDARFVRGTVGMARAQDPDPAELCDLRRTQRLRQRHTDPAGLTAFSASVKSGCHADRQGPPRTTEPGDVLVKRGAGIMWRVLINHFAS